jgi:hypothetical protein
MAEADEREATKKPFHERGAFKAAVAVIGLLGGLWGVLGAPKPWEVATELAANPLPLRNTEIVLDASARMGEPFGKATKLEIAAEAVDRYAAADEHVGLALRRIGGSCDESSEPLVGFDDRQVSDVTSAAANLKPQGSSNLSLAVRTAINDFAGEAFHRPGSENQIVIFAGGGDECGDKTGWEIRRQLEQAKIEPEFHVYAINVSKKEMKSLEALRRQLKPVAPVQLDRAENVEQLYEAVQEDARGADSHEAPAPGQGERSPEPAAPEPAGAQAEESQAEAWAGPASESIEAPIEEEVEEAPTDASKEEEALEEVEEEEKEAEEENGIQAAEEAPAEEEEGEEQEGEEVGSLGKSEPVQAPPKSLPRPGSRAPVVQDSDPTSR